MNLSRSGIYAIVAAAALVTVALFSSCVSHVTSDELAVFAQDLDVLADGVANVGTMTEVRRIKLTELAKKCAQNAHTIREVEHAR